MSGPERVRIHLDTDLGSDTDDLCALAMLLGWQEVDLVAVTTSTDPGGQRAGWTQFALATAGRSDVPVVAGSQGPIADPMVPFSLPAHYWPEPVDPSPSPPGAALDALVASAESGATIVAIGPMTNLAMVEAARPGLLTGVRLVVMGGHVTTPRAGLPPWGVDDDFNVQQDRFAAMTVLSRCHPVVVPLAVSVEVTLRRIDVPALLAGGSLAQLVAAQAEQHDADHDRGAIGRAHPGLPDDLLNFQYDPLACAVAAGWDGVAIERVPTKLELRGGRLHMSRDETASTLRVVTAVRAEDFRKVWLDAVLTAAGRAA